MIDVWTIEDNEGLRNTVTRAVNRVPGLKCSRSFGSCEAALDALGTPPPPQVILLDINLPGINGIEGLKKIKAAAPPVHVIMLTISDDAGNVFEAICSGASGYILKTSPLETITQSITDVMNGGAPMTPVIARSVLNFFKRLAPAKPDYGLSPRELEILQLLVDGGSKKEIASAVGLSYHTIDKHVRSIYEKLQVHSVSAAVAKALRERLF